MVGVRRAPDHPLLARPDRRSTVLALNELSLLTPLFLLEDASASRTHVDEVAAWVRA